VLKAKKEPVIYISLGTVKKIDMKDVDALMEGVEPQTPSWHYTKS